MDRRFVAWLCSLVVVPGLIAAPAPADKPPPPPAAAQDRKILITAYGAVGDGTTMNTAAIDSAFVACAAGGGGQIVVPPGTYLTGPVQLRSQVDLHLEAGATIRFSRKYEDYPLAIVNYEGREAVACRSPIWGDDLHDVSITGSGVIDGQGDAWRAVKRDKLTAEQWDTLVHSGGVVDSKSTTWFPNSIIRDDVAALAHLQAAARAPRLADYEKHRSLLRPVMVLLSRCQRVRLDGPTFRNSPSWNIHLLMCDDVTVRGVTIFNPAYAQNGDGIDIDSCRNVTLAQANVNAGDDAICLKSGRDEEGRRRGRPTENVTIRDCVVGTGHGGIVIGSEMSGGVRNVAVSNCIFSGTDIGLRFKTTRGRGGVVENISVSNVEMSDIRGAAILFDMYYGVKDSDAEPVGEGTPVFRQFTVRNIVCRGAGRAVQVRGLPEMPIEGITIESTRIAADTGIELMDAKDVTLRDVRVEVRSGPGLVLERVDHLATDRFTSVKTDEEPATKPASERKASTNPAD